MITTNVKRLMPIIRPNTDYPNVRPHKQTAPGMMFLKLKKKNPTALKQPNE
jgi:hypothetical protein